MKRLFIIIITFFLLSTSLFARDKEFIAILDLQFGSGVNPELRIPLSLELAKCFSETGKFRVVDRKNIDTILKEQGFSLQECTTDECIIKVGRLLVVEKIVTGNISKIGDMYVIAAIITNVETAEIESMETLKCRCKEEDLFDQIKVIVNGLLGIVSLPKEPKERPLSNDKLKDRVGFTEKTAVVKVKILTEDGPADFNTCVTVIWDNASRPCVKRLDAVGNFIHKIDRLDKNPYLLIQLLGYEDEVVHLDLEEGGTRYLPNVVLKKSKVYGMIKGKINLEEGQPANGAEIRLGYGSSGFAGTIKTQTDRGGFFTVTKVPVGKYRMWCKKDKYADADISGVLVKKDKTTEANLTLYRTRKITFEWVYQKADTNLFYGGELTRGTATLQAIGCGYVPGETRHCFNFSMGASNPKGHPCDIEFEQKADTSSVFFQRHHIYYGNRGVIDLGVVDLDSVTEAPLSSPYGQAEAKVSHVYVVKTYEDEHYAKIKITDISIDD